MTHATWHPLLLASTACLAAGCHASEARSASVWSAEVVLTAGDKLGGCAVGDLHPDHEGNEIAAVGITGEVLLARRRGDGWHDAVVARASGELIQCDAGDAVPELPGDELLAFGMLEGTEDDGGRGAAYLLSRVGDAWVLDRIFEDDELVHAGCIADVDPRHPGAEIVVAGFAKRVHVLHREDGAWVGEAVAELAGAAKCARPYQDGVAIGCADGLLLHVRRAAAGWTTTVLDQAPAGQSRLGGAGERLLAARDDGELALIADGRRTEIYGERDKLRGAVLADLDPASPGLEAATAGYGQTITVLVDQGDYWKAETVFTDTAKLHHLTSGEVLASSPGVEAVGCGYSGKLVVVGRVP